MYGRRMVYGNPLRLCYGKGLVPMKIIIEYCMV
jgi:hypothetical protein